jgi:hypothetical protein
MYDQNISRIIQAALLLLVAPVPAQYLQDFFFKILLLVVRKALPDSNPEHFRRALAADVALWAPVVKSLDLRID